MMAVEKLARLYRAVNIEDGKIYIGQTTSSLPQRKARHFTDARQGRGSVFHRAIRKHGESAFVFEVLAVGPAGSWLDDLEIAAIAAYGSLAGQGYNVSEGGCGSRGNKNFLGKKHTPEAKQKIGLANLGKKHTPEARANMSAAHKGKTHAGSFVVGYKHPEETKRRMSETRKGVPKTGQGLENIRRGCDARRGKSLSSEHRANLSAAILATSIVKCPHCDVSGRARGGMFRYHFDNCKKRGA